MRPSNKKLQICEMKNRRKIKDDHLLSFLFVVFWP